MHEGRFILGRKKTLNGEQERLVIVESAGQSETQGLERRPILPSRMPTFALLINTALTSNLGFLVMHARTHASGTFLIGERRYLAPSSESRHEDGRGCSAHGSSFHNLSKTFRGCLSSPQFSLQTHRQSVAGSIGPTSNINKALQI